MLHVLHQHQPNAPRINRVMLVLAVVLLSHTGFSQIDSLLQRVQELKSDTALVNTYNELAYQYWNTQPLKGVEYGLKAFKLADSIGYQRGKAEAHKSVGVCYWSMGSYDPALRAFLDGLKIAEELGEGELLNRIEHNIALVHEDMGNIEQAVYYFRKNIEWYKRTNQLSELPRVYNNLGTAYFQKRMIDSSMANYLRGLRASPAGENIDEAKYIFINMSEAYFHNGDLPNAHAYLDKAIATYSRVHDNSGLMECYTMLGKLNMAEHNYEAARQNLDRAWALAREGGFSHFYGNLLRSFASLDSARGNFKDAFLHYRQSVTWQDSLTNFRKKSEYERLLIQYRTDQKEKENELLKQANLISQLQIQNNQRVMVVLVIGSVSILSLIVFFSYKRTQYQKKLEAAELQHRLREEKERIAQDLHDNIGSQLTSLSLGLNKFSKETNLHDPRWNILSQSVTATMLELRDTIWAINKEEVTFDQLNDKVRNLIWRLRQTADGIEFDLQINSSNDALKLKPMQAINLFRILQEAVSNSTRHSGGTQVRISIRGTVQDEIEMVISDNGKGFDSGATGGDEHYGLQNMRKRAAEIKADLYIDSTRDKGTTTRVRLVFEPDAA